MVLIRMRRYRPDWIAEAGAAAVVVNQLVGDSLLSPTMASVLLIGMGIGLAVLVPRHTRGVLVALRSGDRPAAGYGRRERRCGRGCARWRVRADRVASVRRAARRYELPRMAKRRFYEALNRLPVALFHEDFSEVL